LINNLDVSIALKLSATKYPFPSIKKLGTNLTTLFRTREKKVVLNHQ
ncbi:MAG: hypothetical protein ACJASL_005246, partial [Paraglaciecola sp.]